jgi:dihydroneopterin aldolase
MDIIFLREIKLAVLIGIYRWEQQLPQNIHLDLEIGLPHSRAGQTGKVEDTIDYGAVITRIRETLVPQTYSLLEVFAEQVAALVIDEFGAPWVKVSVAKLGLIRGVKLVGLTIERGTKV